MSNIYNRTKTLKEVVVHTVGPKRYSGFNEKDIYISEFVGLISPLWHYLGVDVSARELLDEKKLIQKNIIFHHG